MRWSREAVSGARRWSTRCVAIWARARKNDLRGNQPETSGLGLVAGLGRGRMEEPTGEVDSSSRSVTP